MQQEEGYGSGEIKLAAPVGSGLTIIHLAPTGAAV